MTPQLSAQRSLELHGRELQPGMRLSVLVSDPERKKERTDVNKNAKEVHVSQLAKSVTEDDLKKLFAPVCPFSCISSQERHCTEY